MAKSRKKTTSTAAPLGYEAQLWQMADALRGPMDAAEYRHVVLGLFVATRGQLFYSARIPNGPAHHCSGRRE